jgi:hypothetical protein
MDLKWQEEERWLYGSLGAAGPVRHLDPKVYQPPCTKFATCQID